MNVLRTLVGLSGLLVLVSAAAADPVIERVMNQGFKGDSSLVHKAAAGTATTGELDRLTDLLRSLPNGSPPRGGNVQFQRRVDRITGLSRTLAGGDARALAPFRAAVDCKSCHESHRGDDTP